MPPAISTNFPDVLDSRFWKIFDEQYKQIRDRLGDIYNMPGVGQMPTKDAMRVSQVGTFGDIPEFTGTVTYDDIFQGFDVTITHVEYASGFQIQRKLFDDELFGIMDGKPAGLGQAYARTRQGHGAQLFNNSFSVDTTWRTGGDGQALCSNSHTTNSGASTASGFDNLSTAGFSAVALAAIRIQMRGFRGDRAERISIMPNLIIHPPDIFDLVHEVTQSEGKTQDPGRISNVHQGVYQTLDWEYLTDANDFWVVDSAMMKNLQTGAIWLDRVPSEFAMVEDMDTIIGKWRLYARWSQGYVDWRWILGSQVS